jgi:hypothetical protein
LLRGLAEHGLGGKTSAGYGYQRPPGVVPRPPAALDEPPPPKGGSGEQNEPELPEDEKAALRELPKGIDSNRAADILDRYLAAAPSDERTAIARRFRQLFPEKLEKWAAASLNQAQQRRTRLLAEVLGQEPKP